MSRRERRSQRTTRAKNAGVTSSSRFGWNWSGRDGTDVMQRQDGADPADKTAAARQCAPLK